MACSDRAAAQNSSDERQTAAPCHSCFSVFVSESAYCSAFGLSACQSTSQGQLSFHSFHYYLLCKTVHAVLQRECRIFSFKAKSTVYVYFHAEFRVY